MSAEVLVPYNTMARVVLPGASLPEIGTARA